MRNSDWSSDVCHSDLESQLEDGLGMAAEPDRDRSLHRQRVQAGLVDPVPSAVERDQILRPERAEQSDLLLDPAAAGLEVLAERLVLDRVPADSDRKSTRLNSSH